MRQEERRQAIVAALVEQGSAGLDDLARRFGVSRMTIHRDLDDLEGAGLLRKVRGGASIEASALFESDWRWRDRQGAGAKRRIAVAAARLVEPGMSVIVDDSTTALALADALAGCRPLTVITNGLALMQRLAGAPGVHLIALGGRYHPKFNGFFGLMAEEALEGLRADLALLSTSAIPDRAAFHQDAEVVGVKRAMMRAAPCAVLLAEAQKFGRSALHVMAGLDAFAAVIAGPGLDPARAQGLREAGIALTIASEEDA